MKKNIQETRLRLAVFRSNKSISAQIINDKERSTLVAVSEKDLKNKTKLTKIEKAALLGEILAQQAVKKGLKKIRFDRRNYRYHGRVQALAEAARKGGLEF